MNILSPTGLREHEYSDTGWVDNENYNIERLNNLLLTSLDYIDGIEITNVQDGDLLRWNEDNSQLENMPEVIIITTTTTTTTTTTA